MLGGLLLLRATGLWFSDAIVWPALLGAMGVALAVGLVLGAVRLFLLPARSAPEARVAGPHHPVVDGGTASRLAAEYPWSYATPTAIAVGPLSFVSVDGATASRLAAAHPWVNANLSPDHGPVASPGYVFVDSATASHLAAEHPWTDAAARRVYDAAGTVRATIVTAAEPQPHYSFVSVDGALASQLAAGHPWTDD